MTAPRVIGHQTSETPADLQTSPGRRRRLPDDLLRQATKRLQILALLAAGLWLLGPLFGHLAISFTEPGTSTAGEFRVLDAVAAVAFLTSIALYLSVGRTKRSPTFVLDLGLVYVVLMAVALGVLIHWGPGSVLPLQLRPTITWIGPLILMTAAIL